MDDAVVGLAAAGEREVEALEDDVEPEERRVEHAQGLLEQLLSRLVALQHRDGDRTRHGARDDTRLVSAPMGPEPCSWCGVDVDPDDGFRAHEPEGDRRAVFCRLEHVVPWVLQGARWEAGDDLGPDEDGAALGRCVRCGTPLGEERVLLVRHRGDHRIGDAFCGPEHLLEWAKAGGRWA